MYLIYKHTRNIHMYLYYTGCYVLWILLWHLSINILIVFILLINQNLHTCNFIASTKYA